MRRALFACALAAGAPEASPAVLHLSCDSPTQLLVDRGAGDALIQASAQGLLEVVEHGHLVALSGTGASSTYLSVPFRHGRHRIEVSPSQQVMVKPATLTGPARFPAEAILHCGAGNLDPAGPVFEAAAAVATQIATPPAKERVLPLLESVQASKASASTALERALLTHLQAQIHLKTGASMDSLAEFTAAAAAWEALGRGDLRRVAQAGMLEELFRLGRHEDALALARGVDAQLATSDYFAARLRNGECLALRYRNELPDAAACFKASLPRLKALGETLEYVSGLQDYADVLRFEGDTAGAMALGEDALALSTLPDMEWQRGRLHLMLAALSQDLGDIETALVHLDKALQEFVAAKSPRWEAHALLVAADVYVELSAYEEALDFVQAARTLINPTDAPAPSAAADVAAAKAWHGLGDDAQAAELLERSAGVYEGLKRPAELDVVRLLQSRYAFASKSDATPARPTAVPPASVDPNAWKLVLAGSAAADRDCGSARRHLAELDPLLSIGQTIDATRIEAACLAETDSSRAHELLLERMRWTRGMASRLKSPLLARLILHRGMTLRESALPLLEGMEEGQRIARAWHWIQPPAASLTATLPQETANFDQAVAKAMDPDATAEQRSSGARSLLRLLKDGGGPAASAPTLTLQDLQARLQTGDVFLSLAPAGERTFLFWADKGAAGFVEGPPKARLRELIENLLARSRSTSHSIASIEEAAVELRNLVLMPSVPAPTRRLLIDAQSELARIPWSVVSWPDAEQPLVDSVPVSLVHLASSPEAALSPRPRVAVLAVGDAASEGQDRLWAADSEPGLIRAAAEHQGGTIEPMSFTDHASLAAAFSRPRLWLHIAAHGQAQDRLGYAGLWLSPARADKPARFVSWLSAISSGVANELVVLNACSLGSSAGASFGIGFADALVAAGAKNVVAARWETSDSASLRWVPSFYRNVSKDGAAEAVRQSQLALKQDRQFRHPYYWGGFAHFGVL